MMINKKKIDHLLLLYRKNKIITRNHITEILGDADINQEDTYVEYLKDNYNITAVSPQNLQHDRDSAQVYMRAMGRSVVLSRSDEIALSQKIEQSHAKQLELYSTFPFIIKNFYERYHVENDRSTTSISNFINVYSLKKDLSTIDQSLIESYNKPLNTLCNLWEDYQSGKVAFNEVAKQFVSIPFHPVYVEHCSKVFFESNLVKKHRKLDTELPHYHTKPIDKAACNDSFLSTYSSLVADLDELSMSLKEFVSVKNNIVSLIEQSHNAREYMIFSNLKLVISYARKYNKKNLQMHFLDLIQEGNIGLIKAVEKFEYRLGYKFSTYATHWIKQAVSRAVADQGRSIRIPVHMTETINRIRKVMQDEQYYEDDGSVSLTKLSDKTNVSFRRIKQVLNMTKDPVSIETKIGTDEQACLGDILHDNTRIGPDDKAELGHINSSIKRVISSVLSPRETKVVCMRFGIGSRDSYTLEEVGEQFGVTRERVRQIEAKALSKLRNHKDTIKCFIEYTKNKQ